MVLQTNNIDHHRTADFPAFAAALSGKPEATATMREVYDAPAILLIGNNPTEQHPLLAWQIRNNVRLHRSRLYLINSQAIKLRRQAAGFTQVAAGTEGKVAAFLAGNDSAADAIANDKTNREAWIALRDKLRGEQNLVIIFGSEIRGNDVARPGEVRLGDPGREVRLPRRLRELSRRGRHGPLSRPAAWLSSASPIRPTSTTSGAAFPPHRG